uniref:PTS transporter subunit EIIC n=1 Tax=Listeria monocytogenes TaxID=1639 RepID=UPI0039678B6C
MTAFMGTKGLLTAFIAAFVTVNVYKVCVKNNVTIRMPEDVPPNISQVFKDLIPFTVSVVLLYGLELLVKGTLGVTVAESISATVTPRVPLTRSSSPYRRTTETCLLYTS